MKPLLNLTIAQFMERTATQWPGRTALTFKGRRWTYRELDLLTDRIAAGLMAAGVRRGNHVAILSENITIWSTEESRRPTASPSRSGT